MSFENGPNMFQLTKKGTSYLKAGEILVGAMIGVGVFGLPFAFAQAGFFVGMVYLVLIGLAIITLQLMYAEVTLQTPGRHRLVGYYKKYFGKKWAGVAAVVFLGGGWGALVAYVLIGGDFLFSLLGPILGGGASMYQVLFLAVGFIIALGGLKFVSRAEMYLVGLLLIVMLIIIVRGALDIELSNLLTYNPENILTPYGVVLFALGGIAAIPEMKDVMGRYKNNIRQVITVACSLVVVLYGLFAFVVVGVTGAGTSTEAIAAFGAQLGAWVLIAGVVMGFLAVATSFLMLSVEIQEMLEFDYKLTRLLSWFAMMVTPLVVFLLGARNFIGVISFTGAVFGGLTGVLIVILYHTVRQRYCTSKAKCFQVPDIAGFIIVGVFIAGAIIEILNLILG